MDSVSDVPSNAKGFTGFFKYVFDFDETNKSLMFNMLQYAILAIIPTVLALKGIGYVIPEEDEDKGSLEIVAEVAGQLVLLVLTIWFVNKMVRYIPTYSGVDYHAFNEVNFLIPLLVVMLTMQTRLGEKIRILMDRVLDLWDGRTAEKADPKKKGKGTNGNVKVSQPIAGNNMQGAAQPPMFNSSTLGLGGLAGGPVPPVMSQSSAAQAAAMTPGYQSPDFNQFYQQDMVPLIDANEPMAANEMGSPFGSPW
jgi:hypothetical protein